MNAKSLSTATFSKLALGISLVIILAGSATTVVLAGDAVSNNLSASQIFEKSRETYASLASYSDEGQIVATICGGVTTTFTIRMARPNFYQIEWAQSSNSSDSAQQASIQAVWSSGAGDLLDAGWGTQEQYNQKIALIKAAAPSGGAAATIPMTFFNIQCGGALDGSGFTANRQADEKVGNVDCYVITWELQGQTKTLWIGKQDFLILQIRTVVSTEAMRTAIAKWNPELMSNLRGFISTETHTNIVVDKQFLRSDFVPSFPTSPPLDSE